MYQHQSSSKKLSSKESVMLSPIKGKVGVVLAKFKKAISTLLKIFKGTRRILPLITIQMHSWSDS